MSATITFTVVRPNYRIRINNIYSQTFGMDTAITGVVGPASLESESSKTSCTSNERVLSSKPANLTFLFGVAKPRSLLKLDCFRRPERDGLVNGGLWRVAPSKPTFA